MKRTAPAQSCPARKREPARCPTWSPMPSFRAALFGIRVRSRRQRERQEAPPKQRARAAAMLNLRRNKRILTYIVSFPRATAKKRTKPAENRPARGENLPRVRQISFYIIIHEAQFYFNTLIGISVFFYSGAQPNRLENSRITFFAESACSSIKIHSMLLKSAENYATIKSEFKKGANQNEHSE